MWIVRLALRRPYTFIVMSMLIVIVGVLAVVRMPTDIFPEIDIPVISVIWNYEGLPPAEIQAKVQDEFRKVTGKIVETLTPEQAEKFKKQMEAMRDDIRGGDPSRRDNNYAHSNGR